MHNIAHLGNVADLGTWCGLLKVMIKILPSDHRRWVWSVKSPPVSFIVPKVKPGKYLTANQDGLKLSSCWSLNSTSVMTLNSANLRLWFFWCPRRWWLQSWLSAHFRWRNSTLNSYYLCQNEPNLLQKIPCHSTPVWISQTKPQISRLFFFICFL